MGREVDHILQYVNTFEDYNNLVHVDLDEVKSRHVKLDRERWRLSVAQMPKLHTFMEVYDD